jgi:hypothetical protein
MATMNDILRRAFRKIGIVAEDEQMTADQGSYGISELNAMMAGWALMGVDIGHSALDGESAYPLGLEYEDAAVWLLAERLAPAYGVPAVSADMWLRALQNDYASRAPATIERALLEPPSRLAWRGFF